jgi:hypothetical protein
VATPATISEFRLARWAIVTVAIITPLLFFQAVLFSDHQFAYRDAGHFYYPLFAYIQDEWRAGCLPLWNPYHNAGTPLAADGTSSVWYPGKLIFFLPIAYDSQYRLYILAHHLLACAAAFLLVRELQRINGWHALDCEPSTVQAHPSHHEHEGRGNDANAPPGAIRLERSSSSSAIPTDPSPVPAAIAALSYAFGASVLFLNTNVVLLVGAAWLPLALLAAHRMLTRRSLGAMLCLSVILALMILGGDPHIAYHAGLIATLEAFLLWRRASRRVPLTTQGAIRLRRSLSSSVPPTSRLSRLLTHPLFLLTLTALCTFLLTAIQILPTRELVQRSTRADYSVPRTLYEARDFFSARSANPPPNLAPAQLFAGLLAHPDHVGATYQFSIGPWRWLEFLYPNIYGRQYPLHHRWIARLPAEQGDPWVPSLYVGLPAALLALAGVRFRGTDLIARLYTYTLLLSLLAGCGVYGLGYLFRNLIGDLSGDSLYGDACGGLYWLMNVSLPGYGYFRYPGKWLVVSSLALAVLAARGWSRLTVGATAGLPSSADHLSNFTTRWLRAVLCFSACSLIAAALAYLLQQPLTTWLSTAPADLLFGPLVPHGAWLDVTTSLLQSGLVALALSLLVRTVARRSLPSSLLTVLVLTLVAVDLLLANRWLVPTVPAAVLHEPNRNVELLRKHKFFKDAGVPRIVNISHEILEKRSLFQQTSSSDRLGELVQYQRGALLGHYPLSYCIPAITPGHTFELADFAHRSHGLAYEKLWLYTTSFVLDGDRSHPRPGFNPDFDWTDSRVNISHNWFCEPPVAHRDFATAASQIDRRNHLYLKGISVYELHSRGSLTLGIEIDDPTRRVINLPAEQLDDQPYVDDQRTITHYSPDRVELDVTMASPGIVVLGDQFYPGWELTIQRDDWPEPRPAPILRTNRVYRGAWLAEPGHYHLVYRYRPDSFAHGATLSLAAWPLLLICWLGLTFRRPPPNSSESLPKKSSASVDLAATDSSAL